MRKIQNNKEELSTTHYDTNQYFIGIMEKINSAYKAVDIIPKNSRAGTFGGLEEIEQEYERGTSFARLFLKSALEDLDKIQTSIKETQGK